MPAEWHISVETSLNVSLERLQTVAPYVHHYYIDVKDMNPEIYRRYTSISNSRVIDNLHWLSTHEDPKKVTIRLPHILDYNTEKDIAESRKQLKAMGFQDFDCFDYIIPDEAR
jgi:pyruvate formate lyase activating enzyme